MKIYLIRHGKTKGNTERRYVGTTDEGLCAKGMAEIAGLKEKYLNCMGVPEQIVTSPMRRCIETGTMLFPQAKQLVVEEFRECDFGEFEYKNHEELTGNPYYEKWLVAGGDITFPGGESKQGFVERTVNGFRALLVNYDKRDNAKIDLEPVDDKAITEKACALVMVVHGGTIMSILDQFSEPHKDYYDWQVENGYGYVGDLFVDGQKVMINNIERL